MPFRIACPHCLVALAVDESRAGQTVRCSKCNKVFGIPAAPATRTALPAIPMPPTPPPLPPDEIVPHSFQTNPGRVVLPREATPAPLRREQRQSPDWDDYEPKKSNPLGLWLAIGGGALAVIVAVIILAVALRGPAADENEVAAGPKDPFVDKAIDKEKDKLFGKEKDVVRKDGPPPPWPDKRVDDKAFKDFPFRDFAKEKEGFIDKDPPFRDERFKDRDFWAKDKERPAPPAKQPVIPPVDVARVTIKPPALDGDKVVRNLPSTFSDVTVGGGGRFLIFHLPKTRQLAIFDANEAKIVKYLPVAADNVRIAAGLDKLVVVMLDEKIIQRWNLLTFEREVSAPVPVAQTISGIAMGRASNGPLLVHTVNEPITGETLFLDIFTMKLFDFPEMKRRFLHIGHGMRTHGSADGKVFGVVGMHEAAVMQFHGDRVTVNTGEAHGGFLIPGPDGKTIFTGTGLRNIEMRKTTDLPFACIPASQGNFFLGVKMGGGHPAFPEKGKTEVSVFVVGDTRPLLSLGDLDLGVRSDPFRPDAMSISQRLHFIPSAKMIVAAPNTNDKLVLHRFDMQEALDKAGIDYLFVDSSPPAYAVRGEAYSYPVVVKSKKGVLKLNLDSGPEGMKISPTGTLSWNVPKGFAGRETDVILTIGDKAGQEIFHTFRIAVIDERPADVKPPPVVKEDPKEQPKDKEPIVKEVPPPVKVDPAALMITPPKLDKDLTVRELPGAMNDVAVGGGGRFLLLGLPSQRKIAMFDVSEAKVVHYFPVGGDDFSFAAGLTKMVVLIPSTKIIQRYDLLTREREVTATLPVAHAASQVLMGSASEGPVVVSGGERFGGSSGSSFLDLKTLKPIDLVRKGDGSRGFTPGFSRVSGDGTVFGAWESGTSPSGLQTYVLQGRELQSHYDHTSVGHIVPGPDGKYLFTASGIYTNQLKSVGTEKGYVLPSAHGNFYMRLSFGSRFEPGGGGKKDLALHMVGDSRPLMHLPHVVDLGGGDDVRFGFTKFGADKRIHFIPDGKVFVTLPFANDKVHVHRFDVDEALDKAGIDYLFVMSRPPQVAPKGEWFLYQIAVKSKKGGVKYRVDAGPAGMKVDAKGIVSWRVPADATTPEDVILTISDVTGQEVFHTFRLEPGTPAPTRKEAEKAH